MCRLSISSRLEIFNFLAILTKKLVNSDVGVIRIGFCFAFCYSMKDHSL